MRLHLVPCPFIDQDEPACSHRFSMGQIQDAFALCAGEYELCPIYYELVRRKGRPAEEHRAGPRAALVAHT